MFLAAPLHLRFRFISKRDERFDHLADAALNTYVTVQLSFLPASERGCTRIAGETHCPEFDHHMEVPCDLLLRSSGGETRSLAEQLEGASVLFTMWNRDTQKGLKEKDFHSF